MKHILVVCDRSGGKNSALKRALSLQEKTKAHITLLGFCYADIKNPEDLEAAKLSRKDLENFVLKQRNTELKTLLKKEKLSAKQVTAKAVWSKDISKAICKFCENHDVDLVIKSGHRSETWMYTSTDWQLFRYCKSPVMITAGKGWKKKPRILAAVDLGSRNKAKIKLNHSVIEQAKALAHDLNDEVHLVYALKVPEVLADMDLIDPRKYVAEKRKKLAPLIEKLCEEYQLKKENVHIKQGDASKVVPSIANKVKADALVCGSMARKGVKAKLMGNSAEAIVQKLYTDILVVKP
ncbi:universal stress protein [uncultured Pseudoteredinibacter sp.]|uniref:universal stress protein n=1 Tax=uncultured Pseudoteredinibacter sp. TaxID=1641701 RepID=UPI00260FCAB9|nr:universal stress protein [uncultured Pseudoteredinibacter sp.]